MLWVTLWVMLWVTALLPPSSAFLPTNLNYTDPVLSDLFCHNLMTDDTHDHKAITREAIRREVRRFFMENPPSDATDFYIPEDASLSEVYRAYYGPTSSPTPFLKAVNTITWSNAMTESQGISRYQVDHHMDAEAIPEGHSLLQDRYHQLVSTITRDEAYDYGRQLLGQSLNSIQDFYSQSTWIELGNTGILQELGMPGMTIPEVAGPGEATCTNCAVPTGACSGNVIPSSKLSSGYYVYTTHSAEGLVVDKPGGVGKCSHGGSMDESVMQEAKGGINKETSSPCFSPHHDLHLKAVELATQASEHYIANVRDAIGDEDFLYLLDLSRGSALSIVIDRTGSMSQEIEAVKEEARLIVESTDPDLYVLVPYGDPDVGPVIKTSDPAVFLEALDNLELDGGCCCEQEPFWTALQMALINTPDYSSIFCFTDAGANDAQLMEGVIALASSKFSRVTIIYSYENGIPGEDPYCPDMVTSGTDELKRLAAISGGDFVEIDKFDVDEIVGILEEGAKEVKVAIRMREDVSDHQEVTFPIDDSIINFEVSIAGPVSSALLTNKQGQQFDLTDKESLNSTENVMLISHTDNLKAVIFSAPALGEWLLELDTTANISISVTATSTLGLLAEITRLELEPPRPGYVVVTGRPIAGEQYYVEVTLVGYLESFVKSVTSMKFVDTAGVILSSVDYNGVVDDHIYILSEPLPPNKFYIQVDGYTETNYLYSRSISTLAVPVECQIELLDDKSVLEAEPGENSQGYFRVHNYGPVAEFGFTVNDEEEFIMTSSPTSGTIPSMGYVDVMVYFMIPPTEKPGTTSVVTFVASSHLHLDNSNTFITHYLVLNHEEDDVLPTCYSYSLPDCTAFSSVDTCLGYTWSVLATLQDVDSGLREVYAKPAGELTVDDFTEEHKLPVNATYSASCCVRGVEIVAVDMLGNVGKCVWDLGPLEGTDTTLPYVTTTTTPATGTTPNPGSTTINPDTTTHNPGSTTHNPDTTTHNPFTTTPDPFTTTHNPFTTTSDPFTTTPDPFTTTRNPDSTTKDPSSWYVVEFIAVGEGETWVELRWTISELREDLHKYTILADDDFLEESHCQDLVCLFNVTYLDPCTLHTFTLTPHFDAQGTTTEGESHHTEATTLGTVPGVPSNPSVAYPNEDSTSLTWDEPTDVSCLDHYEICYTLYGTSYTECVTSEANSVMLKGLEACSIYHISITSVSGTGEESSELHMDTNTDDSAPGSAENLQVHNQTAHWVMLSWDNPLEKAGCADRWMVSYQAVDTRWAKVTQTLPREVSADHYFTVDPLEACTDYTFFVSAVSPAGTQGTTETTQAATDEVPPTPVKSVNATTVEEKHILATWVPAEVEECVDHYRVCLIDSVDLSQNCSHTVDSQQTFMNLEACVDYEVTVTSVSPRGVFGGFAYDQATTSDLPTSPPTNLTIEEVAAHSARATFGPPLENPLCVVSHVTKITNLDTVEDTNVRSGQDSVAEQYDAASLYLEEYLSGLDACTNYQFSVSAVTASEHQSDFVSQTFATEEDTLSAPRQLTHHSVTTTSVGLQWFEPQDNPTCVASYTLTWTSGDDSGLETYTFENQPFQVMVTVPGLAPCTTYTFTVRAATPLEVESPVSNSHDVATLC